MWQTNLLKAYIIILLHFNMTSPHLKTGFSYMKLFLTRASYDSVILKAEVSIVNSYHGKHSLYFSIILVFF